MTNFQFHEKKKTIFFFREMNDLIFCRCSLFIVQGEAGTESHCLVSDLFDVNVSSTVEEMNKKTEIRIPWGKKQINFFFDVKNVCIKVYKFLFSLIFFQVPALSDMLRHLENRSTLQIAMQMKDLIL